MSAPLRDTRALGTAIYTTASLDDDGSGYVYDPKCVAICWRDEAQIVTSEHEQFSPDLIVVKCTLRAAFGVPHVNGVVKVTGLPYPTSGQEEVPSARSRHASSTLRSPGSEPVRRRVRGMPVTVSRPSPIAVSGRAEQGEGDEGRTRTGLGPRGMTPTIRRTDGSTW